MAIIISKDGKNAKKVEKTLITKEGYLQKYIYDNPESIPLYDFKEGVQLLILVREFPTNSGAIDALGIDETGEIYLVETKLYKNPDKRLVVAQVLDYGASLWRSYGDEKFVQTVEKSVFKTFKISLRQRIKDFYGLEEEDIEGLIDNTKRNMRDGNFRFVVLMDKLQDKLKDLILYINENSRFDIFAVEMEYYKHDEYEIMIPKLFGAEVKKDIGSERGKWDEGKFFSAALNNIGQGDTYKILENVYDFTLKNGILEWGTGGESGSFTFKFDHPNPKSGKISMFTVWTNGSIRFRFANISDRLGKKFAELYFDKLNVLPVAKKWNKDKVLEKYNPGEKLQEVLPNKDSFEKFQDAILGFIKESSKLVL
jgi:hypothetical protein